MTRRLLLLAAATLASAGCGAGSPADPPVIKTDRKLPPKAPPKKALPDHPPGLPLK
jgi:hypothetical protein